MINTKSLKEGAVVMVELASDESEEIECVVKCKFINELFVNIENSNFNGEVYGSSVVSFRKCSE